MSLLQLFAGGSLHIVCTTMRQRTNLSNKRMRLIRKQDMARPAAPFVHKKYQWNMLLQKGLENWFGWDALLYRTTGRVHHRSKVGMVGQPSKNSMSESEAETVCSWSRKRFSFFPFSKKERYKDNTRITITKTYHTSKMKRHIAMLVLLFLVDMNHTSYALLLDQANSQILSNTLPMMLEWLRVH